MAKNKKGMTLVELLVAIVLVGIVLIFIFTLLLGLRDQRNKHNFSYDNQINRTESLYRIYSDLSNHSLSKISKQSVTGSELSLKFEYSDGSTGNLSVTKESNEYYLNYSFNKNEEDEKNYKWKMIDSIIDTGCINFEKGTDGSNNYFILRINVYNDDETNNSRDNNNLIDDIEISYYGSSFSVAGLSNVVCTNSGTIPINNNNESNQTSSGGNENNGSPADTNQSGGNGENGTTDDNTIIKPIDEDKIIPDSVFVLAQKACNAYCVFPSFKDKEALLNLFVEGVPLDMKNNQCNGDSNYNFYYKLGAEVSNSSQFNNGIKTYYCEKIYYEEKTNSTTQIPNNQVQDN